jgi:hypothetical protein
VYSGFDRQVVTEEVATGEVLTEEERIGVHADHE